MWYVYEDNTLISEHFSMSDAEQSITGDQIVCNYLKD